MMLLCHDGTAEVARRLALPFAPFPHLLLDLENDGDCAHVASVQWVVPGGYFQVQCQPYDERDLPREDQLGLDEWLDYYRGRGWQVSLTPEVVLGARESARRAAGPEDQAGR
jgi:hypothetical protein